MNEKEIEMIGKIKDILNECGYNVERFDLTDVWTGHQRDYVMEAKLVARKREHKEQK